MKSNVTFVVEFLDINQDVKSQYLLLIALLLY